MTTRRLLLAAGLLALAACAGSRTSMGGEIKYGATAEEDYDLGQKAMERSDWVEAQKLLRARPDQVPLLQVRRPGRAPAGRRQVQAGPLPRGGRRLRRLRHGSTRATRRPTTPTSGPRSAR